MGVIVHLHTSENPCGGACATSLTRECELNGLFNRIFKDKPIKLVNTISAFYIRPRNQIPYCETRCYGKLLSIGSTPQPIEFSLDQGQTPFPVISFALSDRTYKIVRDNYPSRPT